MFYTRLGVMHFTKCTQTSTLASAKIAKYLYDYFAVDNDYISFLLDCKSEVTENEIEKLDILFVVNSPFGFCNFKEEAIEICKNAKTIIWVQNDYNLKPPSQFKKYNIKINETWTTCGGVKDSKYINWNQITSHQGPKGKHNVDGLLYYGAFRQGRIKSFNKYFNTGLYKTIISTTTQASRKYKPFLRDGDIQFIKPFTHLMSQASRFKCALFIEDEKSHKDFHSLPNRFYEYVSAGVAVIIDASCEAVFRKSGIKEYQRFLVNSPEEVKELMQNWEAVQGLQQAYWKKNYSGNLYDHFVSLVSEMERKGWVY